MSVLRFVTATSFCRFAASFAGTLLVTTCPASAETLTYTPGTITGTELNIVTPTVAAGDAVAGLIHLATASGTVDAWCVDLPDTFVQTEGTYSVGSSGVLNGSRGVPLLTADQIGKIGSLAKYGTALVYDPGIYTSAEAAAAIQIAIWDIEYGIVPPNGFAYGPDLGSPIDAAPPAPSGLIAQCIADVGVGSGNPWGEYTGFKVLYADQPSINQTLLTTVPEASTWSMMLA